MFSRCLHFSVLSCMPKSAPGQKIHMAIEQGAINIVGAARNGGMKSNKKGF